MVGALDVEELQAERAEDGALQELNEFVDLHEKSNRGFQGGEFLDEGDGGGVRSRQEAEREGGGGVVAPAMKK